MIQLGNYQLNKQEMILTHDGTDIILEPKVYAVLIYLCENNDRYITIDELHENVWADRCVSDAAVRRTISKLRQLFNDDHKNPKYVQSLPKRGYKLICPACHVNKPNPELELQTVDISKQPAIEAPINVRPNNYLLPLFLLFLLLILLFGYQFINFDNKLLPANSKSQPIQTLINALPGDKQAISQSPNQQFLAFSGQINEHGGFQIYLKAQNKHDFKPVTHNAHLPFALDFSATNDRLFYSDTKEGASSLIQIDLNNPQYPNKTLLTDYYIISDVFTSTEPHYVYFSGQKNQQGAPLIYRYNLNIGQSQKITSSTQEQHWDIKGAISPDNTKLAVVRYIEYEKKYQLRLLDAHHGNIIFRRPPGNKIFDILWLNEQELLVLDQKQLITINLDNQEQQLLGPEHNLTALALSNDSQLLALNTPPQKQIFIERQLPLSQWETVQIFNSQKDASYMAYQYNSKQKLSISRNQNITTLAKFDHITAQKTPLIETEYQLKFQASALSTPLELIRINNRMALLNTDTNTLTYITHGEEFIGDASFSLDEQSILFSVKHYGQWQINQYDIATQTTETLFTDFRYIRPHGEHYILGKESGELYWQKANSNEQLSLNHSLSIEPNTHWDVKFNQIYWSSHDAVQTLFHQLDITDINNPQKYQRSMDFNTVRPPFSISKDGTTLLHSQRQKTNATILKFALP